MSIDRHITDDLAIVGRTSRARPIALESTLARVGSATTKPAQIGFTATYVHAMRVARASAGLATLAAIGVLVLYLDLWHGEDSSGMVDQMAHTPTPLLTLCVAGIGALAHVIAARLAIARTARHPARMERLAIAASIGGGVAFLYFFGMAFVLGGDDIVFMQLVPGAAPSTAIVVALAMIACIAVARFGVARRRWMFPVGLLLLVATIAVGLATGPITRASFPPFAVRVALTVSGVVALFLIVTSVVLALHARDDQYAS